MIATLAALAILVVPIVVWTAIRYRPRQGGEVEVRTGPKHRWWQP